MVQIKPYSGTIKMHKNTFSGDNIRTTLLLGTTALTAVPLCKTNVKKVCCHIDSNVAYVFGF